MQVEWAGIDRIKDADLLDAGLGTCRVESDDEATGMMPADQGATHRMLGRMPLALGIAHAALTQQCSDLGMALADGDLVPFGWHHQPLRQRYRVEEYECDCDHQDPAAEHAEDSACRLSIHGAVHLSRFVGFCI